MPPHQEYALVSMFLLLTLSMHVKHFVADYLLQTSWMAQGKVCVDGWVAPLVVHAGMHGVGTLLIALAIEPALWWLGFFDFLIHGVIDRGKSLIGQRWPLPISDARFWWLVGFDQFLHHVTSLGLIAVILTTRMQDKFFSIMT